MEQVLDATYLRSGPLARASALGIAASGIGAGILLAAWGVSLIWRPSPATMEVRIANPEIRVTQQNPFLVTQDAPLTIAPIPPVKIDPSQLTVKVDQALPQLPPLLGGQAARDEVIRREVTVFSTVKHEAGSVVTGWRFENGGARVPNNQFC